MKSMTLTTTKEPIPASIIDLATIINSRIGDQNITVTIHDETTGRSYVLKPTERRHSDEALHQSRMGERAIQRTLG